MSSEDLPTCVTSASHYIEVQRLRKSKHGNSKAYKHLTLILEEWDRAHGKPAKVQPKLSFNGVAVRAPVLVTFDNLVEIGAVTPERPQQSSSQNNLQPPRPEASWSNASAEDHLFTTLALRYGLGHVEPTQVTNEQRLANIEKENNRLARIQEARDANARKLLGLAFKDVQREAVRENSRRTYNSHINSVRRTQGGTTFHHLCSYMVDAEVARTVGNRTLEQVISAMKFHWMIEGSPINQIQDQQLRLCLRGRRNLIPDVPMFKGAITRERLVQLHVHYHRLYNSTDRDRISEEQYVSLLEASLVMYACAIRKFQLLKLHVGSIEFSRNGKEAFVTVRKKGGAHDDDVEVKEVHPDFVSEVERIVKRRSTINNTCLFNEFAGDSNPLVLLMADVNEKAAVHYGWPSPKTFHGTHNFRHGASVDAFDEGNVELVMRRTGHQSREIALHYALSDIDRELKMNNALVKSENVSRTNRVARKVYEAQTYAVFMYKNRHLAADEREQKSRALTAAALKKYVAPDASFRKEQVTNFQKVQFQHHTVRRGREEDEDEPGGVSKQENLVELVDDTKYKKIVIVNEHRKLEHVLVPIDVPAINQPLSWTNYQTLRQLFVC